MKKILLILLLLLISINVFAQKIQFADTSGGKVVLREVSWRYPLPVSILNFSNLLDTTDIAYLNKNNIFTGTNIFSKVYIDSLILRLYLLDTGTSVVRNIIPQTTKLYNLGSSSTTWDTIFTKSLKFGNDSIAYLDNGKIFFSTYGTSNKPNIMFGSSNNGIYWDGTYMNFVTNGTLRMFLGVNFMQTANIYPISDRFLNNGLSNRYWINSYTQNLYVDTIKSSVRIDTLYLGTAKLYKGNGLLNINQPIWFPSSSAYIDWGAGNVRLRDGSNYNFVISQWDGSTNDTTLYITGADSSVTTFGAIKPNINNTSSVGTDSYRYNYFYGMNASLDNIYPRTSSGITIGSGTNPITLQGHLRLNGIYTYLVGNETTDGSWRMSATLSGDMIFEYRLSGVWTEKSRITK